MADQVLYSGVACITDLMVKEGLINLDFADVRAVMRDMGKAMMGTGEASGEKRANRAAEAAIANPLLDDVSMKGARGLLISITGGRDLTLYEVDEAATRIREEVDPDANIILGATFDESLEGIIRVSVVATGIDHAARCTRLPSCPRREQRIAEVPSACARKRAPAWRSARRRRRLRRPSERARSRRAETPARRRSRCRCGRPRSRRAAADRAAGRRHAAAGAKPAAFVSRRPQAAPQPVVEAAAEPAEPFIPPQAERAVRPPACRASRTCRCRRRTRSRASAAKPMPAAASRAEADDAAAAPRHRRLRRARTRPGGAAGAGRAAVSPVRSPGRRRDRQRPTVRRRTPNTASAPAPQGYRPAQGQLDPHGRSGAAQRGCEDDQLEIPAFLRRQSN